MTGPRALISADHPLMQAWISYRASAEFELTRDRASSPGHVDSALWIAFLSGWNAHQGTKAESPPVSGDPIDLQAAVINALNTMRRLIEAASDTLFEEVPEGEPWEDHPADAYRDIGLEVEQRLMNCLESIGLAARFDRSDGEWKSMETAHAECPDHPQGC